MSWDDAAKALLIAALLVLLIYEIYRTFRTDVREADADELEEVEVDLDPDLQFALVNATAALVQADALRNASGLTQKQLLQRFRSGWILSPPGSSPDLSSQWTLLISIQNMAEKLVEQGGTGKEIAKSRLMGAILDGDIALARDLGFDLSDAHLEKALLEAADLCGVYKPFESLDRMEKIHVRWQAIRSQFQTRYPGVPA